MKQIVTRHWYSVLLSLGLASVVLFVIMGTTDAYVLVMLASAVVCGMIAQAYRRIWIGWAIAGFVFPPFVTFVLLFSIQTQEKEKTEGPAAGPKWIPIEEWRTKTARFETGRNKLGILLLLSAYGAGGWGTGAGRAEEWGEAVACAVYALIATALSFWVLGKEGLEHVAIKFSARKRKGAMFVRRAIPWAPLALPLIPAMMAVVILGVWLMDLLGV